MQAGDTAYLKRESPGRVPESGHEGEKKRSQTCRWLSTMCAWLAVPLLRCSLLGVAALLRQSPEFAGMSLSTGRGSQTLTASAGQDVCLWLLATILLVVGLLDITAASSPRPPRLPLHAPDPPLFPDRCTSAQFKL